MLISKNCKFGETQETVKINSFLFRGPSQVNNGLQDAAGERHSVL